VAGRVSGGTFRGLGGSSLYPGEKGSLNAQKSSAAPRRGKRVASFSVASSHKSFLTCAGTHFCMGATVKKAATLSRDEAVHARLLDVRRVLSIWRRQQRSYQRSCRLAFAHFCCDAEWAPRHRGAGKPRRFLWRFSFKATGSPRSTMARRPFCVTAKVRKS